MSGRLAGKVVLITGAGGAIGSDIALACAAEGAVVSFCDADAEKGNCVLEAIQQKGFTNARFHVVDVTNEASIRGWVESAVVEFGCVDVLVNNAAAFVFGRVEDVSGDDWDRVLNVNVKGYAFCSKAVVPFMQEKGKGAIVNIASISSFIAQEAFVPYNTSKGAIMQMTRCMAMDLGVHNIRVNAVCPGAIDTPATELHAQKLGITKEELKKDFYKQQFLKRMGEPRDVSNAVIFLASDDAKHITGTHLMVDAGYTAM